MSSRAAFAAAVLALLTAPLALAAEPGFASMGVMDWENGLFAVEITRDLDPSTDSLPRAKGDAETEIEARLAPLLVEALSAVQLDSARTFGNLLSADPTVFSSIRERALSASRDALFLSSDFSRLIARYSLPFFGERGIAAALAHGKEVPIRKRLGYTPSRPFTGLLISARGKLPLSGKSEEGALKPALFPRLFDQEMNVVLEKAMVSPEAIARWGMVGYADSLDDDVVFSRAGPNPLRIAARAAFGKSPTDIVISSEAARQLLTLDQNIALLREGKIVVVYESLE
jgi:hypothetical protein